MIAHELPVITLLFALLISARASDDSLPKVSPEEAAKHLLSWAKPKYPPLAQSMHLQGIVEVEITITESGTVASPKAISGSPILMVAALDSIMAWRYTPFLIDGKPAAVRTTLKIPFALDESTDEAKLKQEAETNNKYFAAEDLCRKQIEKRDLRSAESNCGRVVALSAELHPARKLERVIAYRLLGNALFLQKKFTPALENYQKELELSEQMGKPDGDDLAAAQHHVANGLWATGRRGEADALYSKSEATYRRAHEHIDSEFLKNFTRYNRIYRS